MEVTELRLLVPLRHALSFYDFPLVWLYDLILITLNNNTMPIQMPYCSLESKQCFFQIYVHIQEQVVLHPLECLVGLLLKSEYQISSG